MRTWFHTREGRPHLLVFFLGWGMDETPFLPLTARETDVLLVFDYRSLEPPRWPAGYRRVTVLGWSFGVYAALRAAPPGAEAVFLNGTGAPCHRSLGIPPRLFDLTLGNLKRRPEETLRLFFGHMFSGEEGLSVFLAHRPRRGAGELVEELAAARSWPPVAASAAARVLVARGDRVFPPEAQVRFWTRAGVSPLTFAGGHFPFYRFRTFDDLLDWLESP